MFKKISGVIFLSTIIAICVAQAIRSLVIENWGETVHGTQLSIDTANNIAVIGSTITLTEQIRNRSKDVIWLTPVISKTYVMTNQFGKTYYLISPNDFPFQTHTATTQPIPEAINVGEIKKWSVKLRIQEGIEPGDYGLTDMRNIIIESNQVFVITSNPLNLKIKK